MASSIRWWGMIGVLAVSALGLLALSHGESVPLRKPLSSELPRAMGTWKGEDIPIEQRIVDAVAVDDYVNRSYVSEDPVPVFVYVGYYKSQRTGQTIHSPRNCLPGSGWQPVSSRRIDLQLEDGTHAPVNVYVVEKGLNRLLVMYWYQSHGRIVASEYWGKYYLIVDAIRTNRTDAALVRISTVIHPNEDAALARVLGFAKNLVPELNKGIPN